MQPVDGTTHWSQDAYNVFSKLCASKIVQAEIKGYNKENNIPFVELYAIDEHKKVSSLKETPFLDPIFIHLICR